MEVSGFDAVILVGAAFAVFVVLWGVLVLLGYDRKTAAKKANDKKFGVGTGILGGFMALTGGLLEPLLTEPGFLISVLGLGAYLEGFSVDAFAAGVVVTYVLVVFVGRPVVSKTTGGS